MKSTRDILVIDDEPVVLQGVERICGSEGLSVDSATSGANGLERLGKHAYRLVLCDIMMEDVGGFEFLAEASKRGNRAPVVMTTGYSTVENAVRSLQCGAIDYLAKPFTTDELMAVVRRGLTLQAEGEAAARKAKPCPAHFHRLGYVSWAAKEPEGTLLIGVNDLFVRTMNGIKSVELLPEGSELVQGTACATLVSSDGLAHGVLCPVSGQVIKVHAETAAQPANIEKDPYGEGWLYRVLPSDLEYSLRCLAAEPKAPDQETLHREGETP